MVSHQAGLQDEPRYTAASSEARVLTEAERKTLARRSIQGLLRVLLAQAAVGLSVVVVAGLGWGVMAAVSALVGAAAYFVPNALFALRLLVGMFAAARPGPYAFFWGEAFKLASAVLVLGLVAWKGSAWLVWPALLAGLLGVLKAYVLLLALGRLP